MAHSRIDGVCNHRPGKVAGVADVPLHGVFLLRQVGLATVLTKMDIDGEYNYVSAYEIELNGSRALRHVRAPQSAMSISMPLGKARFGLFIEI